MASDAATEMLKPPVRSGLERGLDLLVWGGVALLLVFAFHPVDMDKAGRLFTNSANIREFSKDLVRPDFSRWPLFVAQMWLTVQIALWGTCLAVLVAVPLGLLCARNITPVWIQQPVRRINDLLRSIPDLVVGLLFITAVGLGPLPGVLALAVNTGSVLAKLFS